jgi:hypothetical protein
MRLSPRHFTFMRIFVLAALALVLAACETTPRPPLMSPLTETGRAGYGYAERPIGATTLEVTYVAPYRRSSRFPGERDADAVAARAQAFDLMLWRSAQLAEAQGYPAFRVKQSRSNVDTQVEEYPYPDPWFGPPFFGPRYYRRPYYYPYPYYPYGGTTSSYVQARVSADIELLAAAQPGDYVAADVIAQARRTYPTAEGGPASVPEGG